MLHSLEGTGTRPRLLLASSLSGYCIPSTFYSYAWELQAKRGRNWVGPRLPRELSCNDLTLTFTLQRIMVTFASSSMASQPYLTQLNIPFSKDFLPTASRKPCSPVAPHLAGCHFSVFSGPSSVLHLWLQTYVISLCFTLLHFTNIAFLKKQTEDLWQPCVSRVYWHYFSSNMCSLCVSMVHDGISSKISNIFIINISVIVICG